MIYYNPEETYEDYSIHALRKETDYILLNAFKHLNTSWKLLKLDLMDLKSNFNMKDFEEQQDITIELFKMKGGKDNVSFHNVLTLNTVYKILLQLNKKGVTLEYMLDCAIDIEHKYEMFFRCIENDLNETLADKELLMSYGKKVA